MTIPVTELGATRQTAQRCEIRQRASAPAARRCNLVLVGKPKIHRTDFAAIVQHVRTLAPDIRPTLLSDRWRHSLRFDLWLRPTLICAPIALEALRLRRGRLMQGCQMTKSMQCRRLEEHGIAVPAWTRVAEGETPDLSRFGKYVVCKPDAGGRGADVKIKRSSRVRGVATDHQDGQPAARIAQEFIYTGPWPVSYRVGTLFGKALFAVRVEADHARKPLRDPSAFDEGGFSVVATGKGCTFQLTMEEDVVAVAEAAHAAFAEIPLLGVDLVRDYFTRKLYVLEVNPSGHTWFFSSPSGLSIQRAGGFDAQRQFGGMRRAAEILVEQTRRAAS